MNFFYDLTLFFLALVALPKFLYDFIVKKKYKKSFKHRCGRHFPEIEKEGRPLIWIHANSVGETKAIAKLAKRIKNHESRPLILLTVITETGFEEGKRSLPEADYRAYLPFDFYFLIAPIVRRIKPDLVILSETDYWFNFLRAAKKSGAKLVTVNGKISERSFRRWKTFRFFAKKFFSLIDLFALQNQSHFDHFLALGLFQEKLKVTGNIKLDGTIEPLSDKFKERIGILKHDLILTIGSTHEPEEKIWLLVLHSLWEKFPELKVIIAPRHPERFDKVATLLANDHLFFGRFSLNENLLGRKILLMDAMGKLKQCYGVSSVAFVGGSFTPKVGGHNVMEPALYGVPVLFGPYMHGQKELRDAVLNYGAGIEVSEKDLETTVVSLLGDKELREKMSVAGRKLAHEVSGATEATWQALLPFLQSLPKKEGF